MKTSFRLLSFAKPIEKFAIPYILFTLLYVIFSSMIYPLLIPLLNTLFNSNGPIVLAAKPHGLMDVTGWFKYYMGYFVKTQGEFGALRFVCIVIIITMLIGNGFRYLSARTMENLRLHTLLNLRRSVFNNVMNMHLGYFNNQRKGDIISKVASDVQVVQYSVTGTLQVVFKEPLQLIAYMVTLFYISPTLTFYSLLIIPISA